MPLVTYGCHVGAWVFSILSPHLRLCVVWGLVQMHDDNHKPIHPALSFTFKGQGFNGCAHSIDVEDGGHPPSRKKGCNQKRRVVLNKVEVSSSLVNINVEVGVRSITDLYLGQSPYLDVLLSSNMRRTIYVVLKHYKLTKYGYRMQFCCIVRFVY